MNTQLLLIVGGGSVFILGTLVLSLFISGRNKKQKHQAFENLIDTMASKEDERKARLIKVLVDRFAQQEQNASELCEDFILAEKQFFHAYLEQRISQKPDSNFYDQLCKLLDTYLTLLPTSAIQNLDDISQQPSETDSELAIKTNQMPEQAEQTDTEVNLKSAPDLDTAPSDVVEDKVETPQESNEVLQSSDQINEGIVDQEQQNDQSGASEAGVENVTAEDIPKEKDEAIDDTPTEKAETEPDPDWGDAFEEAGLKMDDAAEKNT